MASRRLPMVGVDKLRSAIAILGWPKAAYLVCAVLLFHRAVTFVEALLFLLVALVLEFLPEVKPGPQSSRARSLARRR